MQFIQSFCGGLNWWMQILLSPAGLIAMLLFAVGLIIGSAKHKARL